MRWNNNRITNSYTHGERIANSLEQRIIISDTHEAENVIIFSDPMIHEAFKNQKGESSDEAPKKVAPCGDKFLKPHNSSSSSIPGV